MTLSEHINQRFFNVTLNEAQPRLYNLIAQHNIRRIEAYERYDWETLKRLDEQFDILFSLFHIVNSGFYPFEDLNSWCWQVFDTAGKHTDEDDWLYAY